MQQPSASNERVLHFRLLHLLEKKNFILVGFPMCVTVRAAALPNKGHCSHCSYSVTLGPLPNAQYLVANVNI